MSITKVKLEKIRELAAEGINPENAVKILEIFNIPGFSAEEISSFRLWNDYMPLSDEIPYTEEQRNCHILWECLDRSPLGINCDFAIPVRQILAKKIFKKCGDGFVANENCRFNFGNNIEVGENVSWNAGVYIDAKGGVKFGDFAMLTEYVKIFTHSHSEGDHMIREYNGVELGDYCKIYTNVTILPGVKMGKGSVAATGAIVTKSVDDFTLVGGIPAKPMRMRKFNGTDPREMNQYMMKDRLFQKH